MSDSYGKHVNLKDLGCNVGEEGIYKHKSYEETRVIFFIIPNQFNVQFMPIFGEKNNQFVYESLDFFKTFPYLTLCRNSALCMLLLQTPRNIYEFCYTNKSFSLIAVSFLILPFLLISFYI